MKPKLLTMIFLLFSGNALGQRESFEIDPTHTRVAFTVSHAGFSNPIGTFSGCSGHLQFDEKDWSESSISVAVPVSSLNLGDAHWQQKTLDGTFFDVKKFPSATFVSQRVEKISDNTGIAYGKLSIHGIEQAVSLPFTLNALKRHPLNFKRTIGFSATATISRKAFGMNAWSNLVGDEVKIIIELEASLSKAEQKPEHTNGDKK
jgi:polyisoprenoid-binding protein YceI